uniref:uncharacterized protein n=1 Tax=Myxine glutinosa TaxID=7769 RepID=UPI00358EFA14
MADSETQKLERQNFLERSLELLSWENHISKLASKASRRLGILRHAKSFLGTLELFTIHKAFIRSLMDIEESKLPKYKNVIVKPNGDISDNAFVKVISKCKMDVYFYPFNQHRCSLLFISSSYNGPQGKPKANYERQFINNLKKAQQSSKTSKRGGPQGKPKANSVGQCINHLKKAQQSSKKKMPVVLKRDDERKMEDMEFVKV